MACRLYLVTPPGLIRPEAEGGIALAAFEAALNAALEAGDIACVLLLTGAMAEEALEPVIERLRPLAQERAVAFLLQDQSATAAETGCDGVHLSGPEAYPTAREDLGEDAIVGVGCGASRHDAMLAGEGGADYVAFGSPEPAPRPADPRLLTWWQELMTLPCVAFGAESPVACAELAGAGADFVAVGAAIWDHPQGPAAAVQACNEAMARTEHSR